MKVGICWIIDGTVVADTVDLEDVRSTDSYTISNGDHFSYWKNLSPKTEWERKLKDSEWDYYPRCTVVYLQPADDKDLMNRFCVIYDRCIDDSSLQQVYTEFQLAIDSTLQIQTSARYRCSTCSPAHAILSAADNQPGTPFEFAYHWCKRIDCAGIQLEFLCTLALVAPYSYLSEKILDECSEIVELMLQSDCHLPSTAAWKYCMLADTCIKSGLYQKADQLLMRARFFFERQTFFGNFHEIVDCASVARTLPQLLMQSVNECRLPSLLIHADMPFNAEEIIDEYLPCDADQMNKTPNERKLFATLMYTFALCIHQNEALWNKHRLDSFQRLLGAFPQYHWPI